MSITKKGAKRQYGIEPGLVLWLPFDGDVRDYSGNSNHGINRGATRVAGKKGGALSFGGTEDYVTVPANASLDVTNITVMAWVKPLAILAENRVIINKRYNTTWELNKYGGNLIIGAVIGGTGYNPFQSIGSVFAADTWTHIAWTWNGSAGVVYKNGVTGAGGTRNDVSGNLGIDAAQNLGIGCRLPWVNLFFDGIIDEVRIYNIALNANEIWDLYQRGL